MEIITVHTPETSGSFLKTPKNAYMLYRASGEGRLMRAKTEEAPSGGIMGVSLPPAADPQVSAAVLEEVMERNYTGVLLDCESPSESLSQIARALSGKTQVYIPEKLCPAPDGCNILIETAVFSGSLRRRFEAAAAKYGKTRVFADIERVRMDFRLPHEKERGKSLSPEELNALYRRRSSNPYYSPELCAWYFTCRDGNSARFVLYDDAYSITGKLNLLSSMGIPGAFLCYPETEDIYKSLSL